MDAGLATYVGECLRRALWAGFGIVLLASIMSLGIGHWENERARQVQLDGCWLRAEYSFADIDFLSCP